MKAKKAKRTPNACRKMGEAQFFLEQLHKNAARDRSKKSRAFHYNLSAFLGAAKSVVDVAFKEMGIKTTEYISWKSSLDEQERDLLDFMFDQRRTEVHFKGAKVISKESGIAKTFYPHVQPLSLDALLQGSVQKGPKNKTTGLPLWIRVWIPKTEYHFVKGQAETKPVLSMCAECLTVLEKFLSWAKG